jgi:hypothetical protein
MRCPLPADPSIATRRRNAAALGAAAFVVLIAMAAPAVAATIYKVEMPDGSILFTDTPPQGAKILEERDASRSQPPAVRAPTATPRPLPGMSSEPASANAPKARPIDAAIQEIESAERALQVAKRRLELGREPLPGERLGLAGGGSRLSPEYEARVAGLEKEVADAEARLKRAYEARNAAR